MSNTQLRSKSKSQISNSRHFYDFHSNIIGLDDVYTQTYTVVKGDSLFKIGTHFNVTKKEIILVNKLVTEDLYPG